LSAVPAGACKQFAAYLCAAVGAASRQRFPVGCLHELVPAPQAHLVAALAEIDGLQVQHNKNSMIKQGVGTLLAKGHMPTQQASLLLLLILG
jgi:hypothetical protein